MSGKNSKKIGKSIEETRRYHKRYLRAINSPRARTRNPKHLQMSQSTLSLLSLKRHIHTIDMGSSPYSNFHCSFCFLDMQLRNVLWQKSRAQGMGCLWLITVRKRWDTGWENMLKQSTWNTSGDFWKKQNLLILISCWR